MQIFSNDERIKLDKQLVELNANGLTTSQLSIEFELSSQLQMPSNGQMQLACESSQSSIYAVTFEELTIEQQDQSNNQKSIYTALREGELDYNLQGK